MQPPRSCHCYNGISPYMGLQGHCDHAAGQLELHEQAAENACTLLDGQSVWGAGFDGMMV